VLKYILYTFYIYIQATHTHTHTHTHRYIYGIRVPHLTRVVWSLNSVAKSPEVGTTACKDWLCLINYRLQYHYTVVAISRYRCIRVLRTHHNDFTPTEDFWKSCCCCCRSSNSTTSKVTRWRRPTLPPGTRRYFLIWSKVSTRIFTRCDEKISAESSKYNQFGLIATTAVENNWFAVD